MHQKNTATSPEKMAHFPSERHQPVMALSLCRVNRVSLCVYVCMAAVIRCEYFNAHCVQLQFSHSNFSHAYRRLLHLSSFRKGSFLRGYDLPYGPLHHRLGTVSHFIYFGNQAHRGPLTKKRKTHKSTISSPTLPPFTLPNNKHLLLEKATQPY